MPTNRGVAYIKPGEVQVKNIEYPKLRMPKSETDPFGGKDAPHGVILKIVTTNICGSDQHMVRGRTTAPQGLILGHEITGQVIEKGNDVEMLEIGDIVTVEVADGELRVRSRSAAIANARKLMRQLIPDDVSLIDELIADRRAAAAEE